MRYIYEVFDLSVMWYKELFAKSEFEGLGSGDRNKLLFGSFFFLIYFNLIIFNAQMI